MGDASASRNPLFVSWRWRVLVPVFVVLLVMTMLTMYLLVDLSAMSAGATTASALWARIQLTRLVFAAAGGTVVIVVFTLLNHMLERVARVRRVLEALAAGHSQSRTGMKPTDEIGLLGYALDRYAGRVQERYDGLRGQLRRQRRETEHLTAVLEAVPAGIIVQDLDGKVILMNDCAREMLGSQRPLRTTNLEALTAVVTDALGPALAPGLYSLGDPKRVELEGRMLSAQAAAVLSLAHQRVGTVIVLRDITDEVRRERARDALLDRLTNDVHAPLADLARTAPVEPRPLDAFARDMTRHAVALQKLIVEMRELTAEIDTASFAQMQRALPLDTLIWGVTNEWRQVAQAANLTLNVTLEQPALYVLGDERRLRWAIGNIIDNAIKYTPPGGTISVETSGDIGGRIYLRVRDSGVGIAKDELATIFTRFYRGNPVTESGRAIHAPGTGQGLTIARQIIDAHGGTIRVKSARFQGTSVYISLPLTAAISMELPARRADLSMDGETVRLKPSRPAQSGA